MTISDWLDEKAADNIDVSHLSLPAELAYEEAPAETIYFEEIKPCGILCGKNHPFSTVERFGHWYLSRGQDKRAGIHSSEMKWSLFTRDKALALKVAKEHLH